MNRQNCLMALLACAQMHNKQLPEFIITLYKKAIEEINDDAKVLKALEYFATSNKFPSVNDLKERCGIGELDPNVWAASQAMYAYTLINSKGGNASDEVKEMLAPSTFNAISNFFGSWGNFCRAADDADMNIFIAQFRETLKGYMQEVKFGFREDKPRIPGSNARAILEPAKDIVNQLLPEQVRQQLQLTSSQENAAIETPVCKHFWGNRDGVNKCMKCGALTP